MFMLVILFKLIMSREIWNLIWALKAPKGPEQRSQKLRYWRLETRNKGSRTRYRSPANPASILLKLRLWWWFGKYLWHALWGWSIDTSTNFDQSWLSKRLSGGTPGSCQHFVTFIRTFKKSCFQPLKDNESFEIYGSQPSSTRDYIIQEIIDIDAKYISQLKVIDEVFKERDTSCSL